MLLRRPALPMMLRRSALLLLTLLSTAAASCYKPCIFTFCTYSAAEFAIGSEPGRPFSSILCMPEREKPGTKGRLRLGKVHQFGEPRLIAKPPLRISQWQPPGLRQRFDANFFMPFSFANTPYSGVTHSTVQRGQLPFVNNSCWALPIVAYNTIDDTNAVVENVNDVGTPLVNCVALKSFTF